MNCSQTVPCNRGINNLITFLSSRQGNALGANISKSIRNSLVQCYFICRMCNWNSFAYLHKQELPCISAISKVQSTRSTGTVPDPVKPQDPAGLTSVNRCPSPHSDISVSRGCLLTPHEFRFVLSHCTNNTVFDQSVNCQCRNTELWVGLVYLSCVVLHIAHSACYPVKSHHTRLQ